jgi:hypothetical protein
MHYRVDPVKLQLSKGELHDQVERIGHISFSSVVPAYPVTHLCIHVLPIQVPESYAADDFMSADFLDPKVVTGVVPCVSI